MNVIQVARPEVSRYHNTSKFYMNDEGVDYEVHDRPTAELGLSWGLYASQRYIWTTQTRNYSARMTSWMSISQRRFLDIVNNMSNLPIHIFYHNFYGGSLGRAWVSTNVLSSSGDICYFCLKPNGLGDKLCDRGKADNPCSLSFHAGCYQHQ